MDSIKNKLAIKISPKEDALTIALVILGCFVQAAAINIFYVGPGFLSGGITGISLLLNYTLEIPTWLSILLLNLPVLVVGVIFVDTKLSLMSLLATLVFSFAISATKIFTIGEINPILSAIFGGAIIGVFGAPVVKRNATLGGLDIIALILSRKYSISMGTFNIIFNMLIMGVLGIVSGIELAMLSIIAMFVSNTAFNAALTGLNRTHTVFIISDKWDEIAPSVMNDMRRGVTYIPAEGAYTGIQRKLVYCIVKTVELSKLKSIVTSHDPGALFSVIDTKQVIGRGFGAIN